MYLGIAPFTFGLSIVLHLIVFCLPALEESVNCTVHKPVVLVPVVTVSTVPTSTSGMAKLGKSIRILNLRAWGVYTTDNNGTRWRVVEDWASSEVSTRHIRKSQGEERISSCRTRHDDELNISRGVLDTIVGGIVTERTDARVAVISSVAANKSGYTSGPTFGRWGRCRFVLAVHVRVAEAAAMTTGRQCGGSHVPPSKPPKHLHSPVS